MNINKNYSLSKWTEMQRAIWDLQAQINEYKKPQSSYLARGWDDVRVPGTSARNGASAPDLAAWLGAGGLLVPRFNGGVTLEQVYFTIQMPHGYKLGTQVYPHVHWGPVDGNAGNVIWNLEYSWVDQDQVSPAAITIQATDAAAGVAWTHQYAAFPAITPTVVQGQGLSSMWICRLYRDPTLAGDTYGSDAAFLEFDIHYQFDTMGSRAELIK